MKLRDLIRHRMAHSCRLLREGGRHSVYFNATSAVPRHNEIYEFLARKICPDLQVPKP
jgi:mRNA interferase HicA